MVASVHLSLEAANICRAFGYYRNSNVDHVYWYCAFLMRLLKWMEAPPSSGCGVHLNSIALVYQKAQNVLQSAIFHSTKSRCHRYVGTGSRLPVSNSSRDVSVHMREMEGHFY